MANVIFGNHASVLVPRSDRSDICTFYCDVLGGVITQKDPDRDFIRIGDSFYIVLYADIPENEAQQARDVSRSARSVWLELKSDNVAEMREKILASGLIRTIEVPDPHLYFQAPGGQCFRLVGIDEDLSFYEGTGKGPNVAKIKEVINATS